MEKPASLRAALQAALPELAEHPEKLRLFVTGGHIEPNKATLGYKQHYVLSIFIEEFAQDPAYLHIALIHWLQTHQPDILGPHKQPQKPITFEAEPLESDRWDILIEVQLTETILAILDPAGRIHIQTKAEPQYNQELAGIIGANR